MNKKEYAGIDYFRIIAVLLVIAIHTSPLLSISRIGNFILTRIIGRVAVPFFFMTSGFFLFNELSKRRLYGFLQKIGLLYGISIILYLPINIYNGYFAQDDLLLNILKDIIFDGTLYHLWYLPAIMIGAYISFHLIKRLGYKKAFALAIILYIIGLLGDSYFGLTRSFKPLRGLYEYIFMVSDFTRNGVFFAPVFLILGGMIAKRKKQCSIQFYMIGFFTTLLLMIVEGLYINGIRFQRHDSMYILLIPTMFFLFNMLILFEGKSLIILRKTAMIIYIIHPMVIIGIRLIAKLTNMQSLLIDNNLVHYIIVSILSCISALSIAMFLQKKCVYVDNGKAEKDKDRAWIEINYSNLKHNVTELKKTMSDKCEFMAVVKADAYGHGAIKVSTYLNKIGIRSFAVATIDEGIALRKHGIIGDILILGYTDVSRIQDIISFNLIQTVVDYEYAGKLDEYGYSIEVHIKIDTGMHRIGENASDINKISEMFHYKNLNVSGIYTHLCVADSVKEQDIKFSNGQINSFNTLLDKLKVKGIKLPKVHVQSSYGILNYPELDYNYARIGIALYGAIDTVRDKTKVQLNLRPVLSLRAKVALVRNINKDESVSYGRTFTAKKEMLIAVIAIGYADGVPRNLSCESGNVLIHGFRVPIIGRVCMDQLIVDITDVPQVKQGDIVTLIGKDGRDSIYVTEVANNCSSIPNEILSRLSCRLKKIYI
ncbi:membrane bound serine racemase VanT [Vallitalea longa]|uniref:Alanine racemase n=1 Tax=Vallitalea longa TaxID=2936439 RepID=A0A9W5YAS2_9FIRM|nr:serine racemase VanT catalytic subunit [Vallitalea longa]GKX30042.1 membrane bound serine racemase VanT [Vallitalea longa]